MGRVTRGRVLCNQVGLLEAASQNCLKLLKEQIEPCCRTRVTRFDPYVMQARL